MSYRKFKGEKLFAGKEFVPDERVLVTKPDGTVEALIGVSEAGDDVETVGGILCPGLVNAHCHLELSFLEGIVPPHTGMVPFLLDVMRHQGKVSEDAGEAIAKADRTMYENGIVAVGDISNTAMSIGVKQGSPIHYHTFVETAGFVPSGAQMRAETALRTRQQFYDAGLPATVSPHAPYSVSRELLGILNGQTEGQLVSIHNQESSAEDVFFRYGKGGFLELYAQLGVPVDFFRATGKSSLEWWLPCFNRGQQLLLVHNVCTTEEDLRFLEASAIQTGIPVKALHFCLCPNANLYIQQLLPDLPLLLEHNVHIVIGTDSYASNHSLDCWSEIQTLHKAYPAVPLETLLRAATWNGAETLGITERFGSFEKGKRPGIIALQGEKVKRLL